ncbi:hypothetical protein BaRGS_00014856 [Batillaria attramentaria]|uniref:Uncharacterized protein n=1 Tax=Batillaria attramentaria TaxID=370345 RepID=A0ABD0L4C7_9CAEN
MPTVETAAGARSDTDKKKSKEESDDSSLHSSGARNVRKLCLPSWNLHAMQVTRPVTPGTRFDHHYASQRPLLPAIPPPPPLYPNQQAKTCPPQPTSSCAGDACLQPGVLFMSPTCA